MSLHAYSSRPCEHHVRHLRRRQRNQVISRSSTDFEGMLHLAGFGLMRSSTELPFAGPIVPATTVMLAVVSFHRGSRSGEREYIPYLRTIRPRIDLDSASVAWNASTTGWAYDLGQRIRADAYSSALSYGHAPLVRLALDIDRRCARLVTARMPLTNPSLPPLLIAIAPDTKVVPEPTAFVLEQARQMNLPWLETWHHLEKAMRVCDRLNPTKLRLIDSRLFPHVRPTSICSGSLGEFLDLRRHLGRYICNPLSMMEEAVSWSEQGRHAALLEALPKDILAAATKDELEAACRPVRMGVYRPATLPTSIHLSRAAQIRVWSPLHYASRPESFIFSDHGVSADLWHCNPKWMPVQEASPRATITGLLSRVA